MYFELLHIYSVQTCSRGTTCCACLTLCVHCIQIKGRPAVAGHFDILGVIRLSLSEKQAQDALKR